jgi:D-alanyl-D-alanine carboxypeptidase
MGPGRRSRTYDTDQPRGATDDNTVLTGRSAGRRTNLVPGAWCPGGRALGTQRWTGTSGAADLEGTPITRDTRFRIASITKPIVAALVLDAVERGELALDDDVGTLLPGSLRADQPVTVRMLLDHTSGIFDFGNEGDPVADIQRLGDEALRTEAAALTDRYLAGERVIAPDRLLVALAETHDRYFQPGQGYHYSNINYQLAAMVLEKATGATIAELLATRIFEPLELRHTTIAPPDTASPELRGYGTGTSDGQLVDITDDLVAFGNGGNGGIISTADELLTMLTAITAGDLLPHELGAEMKSPTAQSDRTYGLGLATYHLTCGTFHGHEGGVNGTASIAIVQADGTAGTVVALNLRNGSDPRLTELADRLVCGAPG